MRCTYWSHDGPKADAERVIVGQARVRYGAISGAACAISSVPIADNAAMTDHSAIRAALDIGATAGVQQRIVDITTTGAKSGEPRRIEIWFHQIEGRWYILGRPPRPRRWYRNLQANPRFTFHLKGDVKADLSATARPITDPDERRDVFRRVIDGLNDPSVSAPLDFPPLEDWVTFSPLVEVSFDDFPS